MTSDVARWMGGGSRGLATTASRLPFTLERKGKSKMAGTHPLRQSLYWLRPDEGVDVRRAQPAPLDPAVKQARGGDIDELAGLSPAEHGNADGESGR